MGELKEHLFVPYSELQEGDELTDAITIAKSYYLKSEVDKVIAELKHQRDGAFGLANSGLTLEDLTQMAKKEVDRQKYKRCVRIISDLKNAISAAFLASPEYINWLNKWLDKWIRIADTFKETM